VLCAGTRNTVTEKRNLEFENEILKLLISQINDKFLDDKSRKVVPVKDIKHFEPTTLDDFSKKKIYKIYWPQEDDQANLEKYDRSIYEGTILYLGASEESFPKEKRIASIVKTYADIRYTSPTYNTLICLFFKNSSDGDGEVYLPKRKVDEYENKIINQKKKIKTLQNTVEVLKSKNASLETDYDTLKKKLNRDGSNAGIEESSCKEMLKILLQQTTEIKASLKTTLEEPSSRNKNKEKEIIFGSISFPEKPFLTISRRPKHSLFVKDLVSLLWSEEDLSQRSLTGKKHYNSKEIKQPLTPEKRFAIEEAFKDRLKKQQYHDVTIAAELKLVNRYIAEKINDVRKCKSRRNLNMIYDIENNNIPREEEKDLSENEPTSNDMIN
ncbi:BEN domain-containing protein 5, partial [Armadillidium vulgare]